MHKNWIIYFVLVFIICLFLINNSNINKKIEPYNWFRPTKQFKQLKPYRAPKKRVLIKVYTVELNNNNGDIGPVKKNYLYLKVPCPPQIEDMYEDIACQEGHCIYFLKCYKRV